MLVLAVSPFEVKQIAHNGRGYKIVLMFYSLC